MEFEKVIQERFSVRKYQDRAIEEEKLNKILEAGRIAPTAKNKQPQRIYVLKSQEALERVRALTRCAFHAPVVLLFAYDTEEQCQDLMEEGVKTGEQDVSIVATHMMLEAWNLGIGSCWVDYFPNTQAAKTFALPDHEKAVLLMPMGYAAEDAVPGPLHAQYKELSEMVKVL